MWPIGLYVDAWGTVYTNSPLETVLKILMPEFTKSNDMPFLIKTAVFLQKILWGVYISISKFFLKNA